MSAKDERPIPADSPQESNGDGEWARRPKTGTDRNSNLSKNQQILFYAGIFVVALMTVATYAAFWAVDWTIFDTDSRWFAVEVGIAVILCLGLLTWVLIWRAIARENGNRAETSAALAELDELDTNGTDYNALWQDNRRRLNIYHDLVTDYAHSTRIATIATIAVGFLFIVVISIIGVLAKEASGAVASSVIGACGALLTGFIANAVLKNAASSQRELLSFFSHPLEVERALSAERVIKDIADPKEKATSQRLLIEFLTAGDHAGPALGSDTSGSAD